MEDPESPVVILEDGIHKLVEDMKDTDTPLASSIEWDAEGWHYAAHEIESQEEKRERIALYILALDAINFCFWPHDTLEQNTLEYDHLAIALKELATSQTTTTTTTINGTYFFSPQNLSTITEKEMKEALKPYLQHHVVPNLSERCRLWNELGAGLLLAEFEGSAMKLIETCHNSAPRLVKLIISNFSGFRDETVYQGKWICFYKRAQIAVADLNAALSLDLEGLENLTTFADYRVPQLLRHVRVLEYNQELENAVDNRVPLSGKQEVYVRAATVMAVERLVHAYNLENNPHEKITAVQMDWHLWQVGEKLNQDAKMNPHHCVNTIFY
jgi:hypothetical protein